MFTPVRHNIHRPMMRLAIELLVWWMSIASHDPHPFLFFAEATVHHDELDRYSRYRFFCVLASQNTCWGRGRIVQRFGCPAEGNERGHSRQKIGHRVDAAGSL